MTQPRIPGAQPPFLTVYGKSVSKSRIDRAGDALRSDNASPEDSQIANEFRRSHQNPMLSVRMSYTSFAKTVGITTWQIAQRLKRLDRIEGKLKRENTRLTQLQDIGGVRLVVPTLMDQQRMASHARSTLKLVRESDYLTEPRASGYRAIHQIARRNDRLIEVQIRTVRQHYWADTIEQISRELGTELKWQDEPIAEAVALSERLAEMDAQQAQGSSQQLILEDEDDK